MNQKLIIVKIVFLNQIKKIFIKKSKTNGYQFKLILAPKMININGINLDMNIYKENLTTSLYEIDCNILGIPKIMFFQNNNTVIYIQSEY